MRGAEGRLHVLFRQCGGTQRVDRVAGREAAETTVTGLLRQAQEAGLLRPGVDTRSEAVSLLAMSAGLGTSILVGQRSAESAAAVLEYHLDRIFSPGGRRSPVRQTRKST
ncbi:TetR family transcriptional regulator C-terminal domain-containing protein [Streptomyces spinoverrucosus]|nr:TetR family transcriptional regulator C-terminal domain-containing protein [Streptomyces spinoverrucosus]